MVERQTPEREVGSRKLPPACCVLDHDTSLLESTVPSKRWLRPDMTEKLLTWTLSPNTNKYNNADVSASQRVTTSSYFPKTVHRITQTVS